MTSPNSDRTRPSSKRLPRVLVADGETVIAETLRAILSGEGFEAEAVFGGRAAVRKAQQWQPDLFLTDVMMSDMDGIQIANRIREMFPRCKVVLLVGDAVAHDLIETTDQENRKFKVLFKPIHPLDLIEQLRILLEDT